MRTTIVVILICGTVHLEAAPIAWTAEKRRIESEQVALWETRMEEVEAESANTRIEVLRLGLRNLGNRQRFEGHSPEVDRVYGDLRNEILSIPGHANYFSNEIHRAKGEAQSAYEVNRRGKVYWGDYNRVRASAFDTLAHLPSIETVGILGEFLSDDKDLNELGPNEEIPDSLGPGSNAGLAVFGLRRMIQDPPFKAEQSWIQEGEIRSWQTWLEQIKEGKRTFRLVNDATEYDLNGPALKQKLERIARDRKRDAERQAGTKKAGNSAEQTIPQTPETPKSSIITAIIVSCLLLAGAMWRFTHGRAKRA